MVVWVFVLNMKLIFDISLPGEQFNAQKWQTGLFRYADTLLGHLHAADDLTVYHSNTVSALTVKDARKYLSQKYRRLTLANKPAYPLPRKVFGKGVRTINRLYHLMNIDIDRLIYDEEVFARADIFHTPYNKISDEVKKYTNLSRVITIHDLIPIILPNHLQKGLIQETIQSVGNDYVICVSHNTRNDLLNYEPRMDPDHVFVSHLAADPEIFYPCSDRSKFQAIQKKHNLPERYFLSLATLEPRKNLDHLIRCFLKFIREQHINDLYLVLAGAKGWEYDHIFSAVKQAGSLKKRIIFTGRIPDEDLAVVYSNANSFYFMSEYEGFGLPPLEAMQCGVPVVTSDVSSLPEVVGDGGIMLPPRDEDALCDTMYRLHKDQVLREHYKKKALARARSFSWDKCVREHMDIYKTIFPGPERNPHSA